MLGGVTEDFSGTALVSALALPDHVAILGVFKKRVYLDRYEEIIFDLGQELDVLANQDTLPFEIALFHIFDRIAHFHLADGLIIDRIGLFPFVGSEEESARTFADELVPVLAFFDSQSLIARCWRDDLLAFGQSGNGLEGLGLTLFAVVLVEKDGSLLEGLAVVVVGFAEDCCFHLGFPFELTSVK